MRPPAASPRAGNSPAARLTDPARAAGVAAVMAAVALTLATAFAPPAAAAVMSTLVYSTDGGPWTMAPIVASGQQVVVREYYDSNNNLALPSVSVTATLPAGFHRVPGTTKVCLNPGTTNPTVPSAELACNTDTGQTGAINENAVWSGRTLTISPTAGLFGQSSSARSGILAAGEKKYLDLSQCNYYDGSATDSLPYLVASGATPNRQFGTGTSASNTAQTSPACRPGAGDYVIQLVNSGVANISLLGRRYLNLNQCDYYDARAKDSLPYVVASGSTPNTRFGAGTTSSNAKRSAPACSRGTGAYALQSSNSGVQNVDLLGNRYLNLAQCNFYNTAATDSLPYELAHGRAPNGQFGSGTSASNTVPASPDCAPGSAAYRSQAANSGRQDIDLLDRNRGQGFVQFTMAAPSVTTTTTESQSAQLIVGGTGRAIVSASLTIVTAPGTPMIASWRAALISGGLLVAGLLLAVRRYRARR